MNLDKYQKRVLILGYIMGRLGKVFVLVFLISSLGMINLPSATADGVVDQSNIPGVSGFGANIGPVPLDTFQTFTTTNTDIVAVDIYLGGGDAGVRLNVIIRDNLLNTVIQETDFNPGCPCDPSTPVHVDFTFIQFNPLKIAPIENKLDVFHSFISNDAATVWGGSTGDAYVPGSATYTGASAGEDFFFVTFGPSPVGSISIPIDATSLLLADTQSFSWMIPVVLSVIGIGLFVVSRKSE